MPSQRRTKLQELRAKHKRCYDALDGVHWGCICDDDAECLLIVVIVALDEAERKAIGLANDLRKEHDLHGKEIRKLSAEIAGLEAYNRRLEAATRE